MARTRLYPPSVDPGFPKLPSTPKGWSHASFADVLDVVERPIKLSPHARYKLLTAKRSRGGIALRGELYGHEILTKTQFEAKAGDFLISRRQIIHGACGVVSEDLDGAIVSNEYSTLRTKPPLLMEFLRHYSHTPYFQRTCFHSSHGVDVEKMIFKIDEWLAREVDVPPLGEQRKIAAILSSVDDAIEATQAVIDQLGHVKNAMMAELLTRGLRGRHTRFKQTEIGEVPEEWDVVQLGAVCERMFVGIAQAATHAYVASGGVPIIRTTNVRPNLLRADDILHINDTFAQEMRSKRLRVGDVLSARTGYPGTSVVVPSQFDGAQCFTLLVSRPGPRLVARFLCHLMNSEIGRRIVQQGQAGGAQQNLNVGVFEKAVVGLPPIAEQAAISDCVDAAYEREWSETAYVVGLRTLKAALMSVLLTGEVRVKPDDEAA